MIGIPEFEMPKSVMLARTMQENMRSRLTLKDDFAAINIVAGIDVGYDNVRGLAHASIVTMLYDNLKPLQQIQKFTPVDFPYIPGLLSFREIPAILVAMAELEMLPDLLMVDGQGIAHPRRMGIAAHLGVIVDIPSIGVAKSRLTGQFDMPGPIKGNSSPLLAAKEQIGTVLRSKDNVKPLFISPGHRVSLATSVMLTMHCLTRYRLPEPTRLADKFSKCKGL